MYRKGHIGPVGLVFLLILTCTPLIMASARLLAYPGMPSPDLIGFDRLRQFGAILNQSFTYAWVPPVDRWNIVHLLMLPTAALLVTFARLTFGLRVLGFRSILISVGFLEIGVIPSLILIGFVIAAIVLIRPAIRSIRLPLYARVSVLLCFVALIMIAALLVGTWTRSEIIWSVAFFPVIILAMLAEGFAKTIDRDNAQVAAWRLGWTVIVALLIASISQPAMIRDFALHFPELIVTQLAAIVLVSEYLDFRLLQNWQENLGQTGSRGRSPGQFRIAVLRNPRNPETIGQLGVLAPSRNRSQSVQGIVDVLRDAGFKVKVFEGDTSMLRKLQGFLPPNPRTGAASGLVLNLATGIQGKGHCSHIPSMLEMSGAAYTGPDPVGHAKMADRYALMSMLQQAGICTPRFQLLSNANCNAGELQFPLAVYPRCEPEAKRIIVDDAKQLNTAIQNVTQGYAQDAFVVSFLDGPEIRVSLLGNENIECLPLLQVDSAGNGKICPAPIVHALADKVRETARSAYTTAGCRDFARIDIRFTSAGEPCVVQIHSLGILARRGSFVRAGEQGGYSFRALMNRIVEEAWIRHGGEHGAPIIQQNINPQDRPRITPVRIASQ